MGLLLAGACSVCDNNVAGPLQRLEAKDAALTSAQRLLLDNDTLWQAPLNM